MMSRPGLTILWTLVLVTLCHAGPINRQAGGHNTLRPDIRNQSYTEQNVCVNDDVLYQPGDLMPAPTPCARCVCSPPGSLCTPVACEKKPGCKALLRPNQCCPEYQCECERNGRLYANGERLDNADNPCQACYCQGGEVVCTTVECYRRDDCEPQFVPGRCCPKYDHCPPLVMDDSRYGEPFLGRDRPQHTRATFQPTSGLEGEMEPADPAEDDQALGASNVQERVHVPQVAVVATATTTPAPAPATDAPASATNAPVATATEASAAETDASAATDAPATHPPKSDTPRDAAIKIDVPAMPWTETPKPSATDATTQVPQQANEEGSGATEGEALVKMIDEPVIGVIERIHLEGENNNEGVDETATAATTLAADSAKDDTTETQTEQEPITRLFMLSKEAELDPTTVSSEYTDIPEEMSTLPETTLPAKETTVASHDVDVSTEALLEATTTKGSPIAPEVSTDSSPEFKDFDEWSASKSSEFLRDSASIGSSGGSSSGSEAPSKPTSSSDESRSQILATNINAETVKLSSDQSTVPHSVSSIDSTESVDSTEESATTEIVSSTENENTAKADDKNENVPGIKFDESESKEDTPLLQKINEEQLNENAKDEEKNDSEGSEKEKRQPDIVLDTDATDENGPPILLIGEELANHQMDIVVATSSTEGAETETPIVNEKPESRLNQGSTDQPSEATDVATDTDELTVTTEQFKEALKVNDDSTVAQRTNIDVSVPDDTRTEEPVSGTDTPATDDATEEQSRTEAGSGDDGKDAGSSTEKLDVATAAEEIMMSDDPLPGQAASAEIAQRNEDLEDILGKTGEKKEDSIDAQSATLLTTLPFDMATENPVEVKLGDLKTESPERESTTNTAKEEDRTTLEPKYDTTTVIEAETTETKQEENQKQIKENVAERRADTAEQVAEEEPITEKTEENPTTTESLNIERTNADNEPIELAGGVNMPNEEITDLAQEKTLVRAQIPEDKKSYTDNQSPGDSPKDDTTTVVADATDVPTTQNPETTKASNTNSFDDDVMLGDQSQNSLPATKLQTIESKEQKIEEVKEQKKEEEELKKELEKNIERSTDSTEPSASITDKIQTIEPEQTTEIKERVTVDEISDSTPKPESDLSEPLQTTALEQNTESDQKAASDTPQEQNNEETVMELEQKGESQQKSDVNLEQEQQEKEEEPSQILVDSAKIPENDEVAVRAGEVMTSDEFSTPPPDTTSSDIKIQDETITSLPAKTADPEEVPSTDSTVDATSGAPIEQYGTEQIGTGVKINPEVLELKAPTPSTSTASPSAINASEISTFEPDPTTLSPEWLKSDNTSKEEPAQGQKEEEQQTNNEESGVAVTEQQAPPAAEAPGDADGGEQQRVERRVDETDKKDLFLLEDFFTKLYRHQIATDANKEH